MCNVSTTKTIKGKESKQNVSVISELPYYIMSNYEKQLKIYYGNLKETFY